MSSDISDEQLERVVRRAVRAELELLGERLFWTLLATFAAIWGAAFVANGLSDPANFGAGAFGVVLLALAVWRLLWTWDLPPFRTTQE
jgi:cytochrome b561